AKRLGATVRTGMEVVGIERQGEKITAVLTPQGKISTDTVVNAAGPWSSKLAQMVNVHLPVEPRKGELFVTEPGPSIVHGIIISASYLLSKSLSSKDALSGKMTAGLFASQARRGNLVIGSTREFSGYARQSSYRGMHKLVQQTAMLIPASSKLHVLRFYAGLRPSTPDGLPILGRTPELPGFVIASGHEGDGIALSPITGKSIADLIIGQITEEALVSFSPKRFH
ncbi:MAG: FAD-binding oxidoreductase, partial [Chloroflexi bacterium]|nr:FAD-binding oxidoreductase [Chloroflexota bacterium]